MNVAVTFGLLIGSVLSLGAFSQDVVPVLNADFESSSLGGFTQSQSDSYDWEWRTGRSRTNVNGPLVDHSTSTSAGHFMFVHTVSWRSGSSATLLSPVLVRTGSRPACVRYFFYMTGITPGSLTIRLKSAPPGNNVTSLVIGQQSGDMGPGWNRGLANIPPQTDSFQMAFEATSDNGIGGEIAVDDIQFLNSACPEDELHCSFESPDLCGFLQDTTDGGDLVHMSGKTDSFYTGPSFDHTFGNSSGHYVYMEATPLGISQKVRLVSPTLRGVPADHEAHCLVFWYHMYGLAIDSLSVYIVSDATPTSGLGSTKPDWIIRGNRGNRWRATEVSVTARTDYKIVFEFSRGERYDGDIAIDDVIVTDYACPGNHIYANTSSVSCDFEEADLCHYKQDRSSDSEDWQWGNGATYVEFTGPSTDHTRGDELGFYLYFERSVNGGNDARISSPPIQPQNAPSCVEFWYHMYGTDVNALTVYINRLDGDYPDKPVWNMTGNRGDSWHRAEIMVPASKYPLELVFHAFGGTQFRDNIAIDDVRLFESGECPEVTTTYPSSPPIPPLVHTLACNFESDWCNFTQMTDDVFDWRLGKGPNTNQDNENMVDHTYANTTGTYAYIDTSQKFLRTDDKARIISPLLSPAPTTRCFTFYYFMSSENADFLNVYVVPYGGTESFDPQYVIYGTQAPKWLKATVPIESSMVTAVHVIIEGVIGPQRALGDIAIDDIKLEDNECSLPEDKPSELPLTADCDFELDRGCDYVQSTEDQFDWVRHRGRTDTLDTGPQADHTMGTPEGFYFYAEASQPRRPGDKAAFLLPPISGGNQRLCLRFFYFMDGVDTGSLRISLVLPGHHTGSSGLEMSRLTGKKMTAWLPLYLDIFEVDGPLQIKFEAVIGNSFRSDIAVDDIEVLRHPCDGLPTESLCDFEKGLDDCNYQESGVTSIYFQWSWYDSSTISTTAREGLKSLSSEGTIDSFVHVLVEDKSIPAGTTSNISSPYIASVPFIGHCVEFNYALIADGEIDISVYQESKNGTSIMLQKLDTSSEWRRISLFIDADQQFNPFRITFVAEMGMKQDNDAEIAAIDDIAITLGSCKPGNASHIDGEHIPVLALALLLTIAVLALFVVCVMWVRRRNRTPFPVMLLQRRQSDERPITMSLSPSDTLIENGTTADELRS